MRTVTPFLFGLSSMALFACGSDEDLGARNTVHDGGNDAAATGGSASGSGGRGSGGRGAGGARSGGAAGRGEDAATPTDASSEVPTLLRFEGTAEARGEGGIGRVECQLYGEVLDVVFESDGSWSGLVAGEVFRNSYDDEARGEFSALVGGPSTLARTDGGSVEVRLMGDQPTDAPRFWLELEAITGTATGPYSATGTWTCAPILLGDPGFLDLDIDAPGTWSIGPNVADR